MKKYLPLIICAIIVLALAPLCIGYGKRNYPNEYYNVYLDEQLLGRDDTKENGDKEYRHQLEKLAEEKGNEYIHNMLKEVDSESAAVIHMNNTKRVIRALEYYKETGKKFSQNNEEQRQNLDTLIEQFPFSLNV